MIKQVIKDQELVSLVGIEEVNLKFWKYQNQKELNRVIKEDKKVVLQAIVELPKFEMYVREHEILWDKHRSKFSVLEKEYVDRTYHNLSN